MMMMIERAGGGFGRFSEVGKKHFWKSGSESEVVGMGFSSSLPSFRLEKNGV